MRCGDLRDRVADNENEISSLLFGSGFHGITDIATGPDGYLYILTLDGSLYAITPKDGIIPETTVPELSSDLVPVLSLTIGVFIIYCKFFQRTRRYSPNISILSFILPDVTQRMMHGRILNKCLK